MSFLHDWQKAPKPLVHEYIESMATGDTKRCRQIKEQVHAKNKLAQNKNPGLFERLFGNKEMPR